MFYETKHPVRSDYFKIETGDNYIFPPHIHRHFEFITVIEGEMRVTVGKTEYILRPDNALLIFPNQVHSLFTEKNSRHILCIFSPELVKTFSNSVSGKTPVSNIFNVPVFYVKRLLEGGFDTVSAKGLLYSICGEFAKTAHYRDFSPSSGELLDKIFDFVEKNHYSDCTLKNVAEKLAYDYTYISKYFKRCVGISFCGYVNAYRLGDACYLLKNSALPVVQIAYECGFSSVRSFNRNFKDLIGLTPVEYRAKVI